MTFALNIRAMDKPGVLGKITSYIAKKNVNIIFTQVYNQPDGNASTYIELENVEDIDEIIKGISEFSEVFEVMQSPTMNDVWGKRIIIIGGGAQVSQVALGAITEADRHNIRGEHISVDTLPIVGEENLTQTIRAVGSLPRVKVLVLAGSLMGGTIVDSIKEIKEKYGIKVISLNMVGSVRDHADLVVTDPVQAGVMAVMSIANTAQFDIGRVKEVL
ncbi:MAG: ACT domain-containing protein [Methanosphaera stadtmanae]|jgi:energy-converting hydrogenase B subunit Q|nr:ACT domain-containing protein [Methanosphaera stadtmanae]